MSLEYVDAYFVHKIWHEVQSNSNSGIPFLIGSCAPVDGTKHITVLGELLSPVLGDRYKFYGEWKTNSKKNIDQFHFYSFEIIEHSKSPEGIALYLENFADDIGPKKSKQIVDHFGAKNILKILRETPYRIKEVKGIGTKTVEALIEHFEQGCPVDPASYAAIVDMFDGIQIPQNIIKKILDDFGANAIKVIRANPYLLLDYSGLGWKTVDSVARKKLKYDPDGIHRIRAGILEVLKRFSGDGDTVTSKVDLQCKASTDLGIDITKESIDSLIKDELIVETSIDVGRKRPDIFYSLYSLWSAELEISVRLKNLIKNASTIVPNIDTTGLEGLQIKACEFVRKNPVCAIIGPPGVGKTTTITKIIESLYKNHFQLIFVAPTGKAAKRASEVLEQWIPNSGIPATTIHRSLEPMPYGSPLGVPEGNAKFGRARDKFCFTRNEDNPIEISFGIIDEMSMVDTELFISWLRAVPIGCRLIFVGDVNQIPSVGAGAILRDMISGGIPTFALTEPRRNSGRIVHLSHAMKDGRVIAPSKKIDLKNGENVCYFEEDEPEKIAEIIVSLHDEKFTDRDLFWDMQVISPQNEKLPIACDNLNRLLSLKLNPDGKRHDLISKFDNFRIGDKVVRTKNAFVDMMEPFDYSEGDYDDFGLDGPEFYWNGRDWNLTKTLIVNGDIGKVVGAEKFGGNSYIIVNFRSPDRLCCLKAHEANLSLAYAMTVHKAQGSGFPVVIIPSHESFHWNKFTNTGLWCRELVYTGASRPFDLAIIVGKWSALELAVSRKTIDKRKTLFSHILKETLSNA